MFFETKETKFKDVPMTERFCLVENEGRITHLCQRLSDTTATKKYRKDGEVVDEIIELNPEDTVYEITKIWIENP